MRKKFSLNYGFGSTGVSTLLACGALAAAFQAFDANATTSFSELPDMSQLTQFATFGNSWNLNLATVNGPAGISQSGTIAISGPSTVNGNLYLGVGASKTGGGTVTGTTFTGANIYGTRNLTEAQAQVFSASSTFAGMTADKVINGNVSSSQIFGTANGVPDIQVLTINGNLSLGGSSGITFVGDTGDVFVLNVTGTVSMGGSSFIGSLGQAAMTIINLTSPGSLGTIADINTKLNGTILIPNVTSATLHSVSGAIYSGFGQITLMSGATVNFIPFVPEPSTILTGALLMLLPLGGCALRVVRKR